MEHREPNITTRIKRKLDRPKYKDVAEQLKADNAKQDEMISELQRQLTAANARIVELDAASNNGNEELLMRTLNEARDAIIEAQAEIASLKGRIAILKDMVKELLKGDE